MARKQCPCPHHLCAWCTAEVVMQAGKQAGHVNADTNCTAAHRAFFMCEWCLCLCCTSHMRPGQPLKHTITPASS